MFRLDQIQTKSGGLFKQYCDKLIIGLHVDPSIERKEKLTPILSLNDRIDMLYSIKDICDIFPYKTENELYSILKDTAKPDIMFLGDDHKNDNYTGKDLNIPVVFLDRNHGWSATKFKKMIYQQMREIYNNFRYYE